MKKLFLILTTVFFFAGCTSDKNKKVKMDDKKESSTTNKEDKEERNKQVAIALMAAFEKNEMDKVFADADPSFMDYGDGSTPPMPLDSVKSVMNMLRDAIPDYKGSNLEFLADGDKVVVVGEWSGTLQKDLMGIKPTGKPFNYKDVDIFSFNENGKIISHHSIANMALILMTGQ